MRYGTIKKLKGEEFRRLTGVQRETFDAIASLRMNKRQVQGASANGGSDTLPSRDTWPDRDAASTWTNEFTRGKSRYGSMCWVKA